MFHGCFYGLDYVVLLWWNYVTVCACLYDMSMLAPMLHLWATIRGPCNELSSPCNELSLMHVPVVGRKQLLMHIAYQYSRTRAARRKLAPPS
jgi:hypothetical protein